VQHVEQFDEERHFLHRATLDQGQDEFALLQADKEIGVFAAGGNPLEIKQAAEAVRGEKGFQLGPSQGVNTDMVKTASTGAASKRRRLKLGTTSTQRSSTTESAYPAGRSG
jgi:hypothetical protein